MAKCVVCEVDAAKYKCSRCLAQYYCSVACCKKHFEGCVEPVKMAPTQGVSVEEGEIEAVERPSRFAILKGIPGIKEWMTENKTLLRQMLTAPDPILAVQRQRKSNKSFNEISVKILTLL